MFYTTRNAALVLTDVDEGVNEPEDGKEPEGRHVRGNETHDAGGDEDGDEDGLPAVAVAEHAGEGHANDLAHEE